MAENSIKLTGWPAVGVAVLFVGFAGFRMLTARADLDKSGADELRLVLVGQYAQDQLATMKGRSPTTADANALIANSKITFPRLDARGGLNKLIVRATVRVNGGPPPDGRDVRYFKMTHSTIGGWRLQREVSAFTWYITIF